MSDLNPAGDHAVRNQLQAQLLEHAIVEHLRCMRCCRPLLLPNVVLASFFSVTETGELHAASEWIHCAKCWDSHSEHDAKTALEIFNGCWPLACAHARIIDGRNLKH